MPVVAPDLAEAGIQSGYQMNRISRSEVGGFRNLSEYLSHTIEHAIGDGQE